mmetsp:Transcript_29695/g.96739  ORF Transcript_29695/g.96739 Transcript_29695/m.96739 type:complete len:364 (-) Transcript_29695:939-2030(-)
MDGLQPAAHSIAAKSAMSVSASPAASSAAAPVSLITDSSAASATAVRIDSSETPSSTRVVSTVLAMADTSIASAFSRFSASSMTSMTRAEPAEMASSLTVAATSSPPMASTIAWPSPRVFFADSDAVAASVVSTHVSEKVVTSMPVMTSEASMLRRWDFFSLRYGSLASPEVASGMESTTTWMTEAILSSVQSSMVRPVTSMGTLTAGFSSTSILDESTPAAAAAAAFISWRVSSLRRSPPLTKVTERATRHLQRPALRSALHSGTIFLPSLLASAARASASLRAAAHAARAGSPLVSPSTSRSSSVSSSPHIAAISSLRHSCSPLRHASMLIIFSSSSASSCCMKYLARMTESRHSRSIMVA